jgi:AcrR family transcriptional regulator
MVEAASELGYGDATVAQVVERAGVSRATFYEHFASREECFLAAYRLKASAALAAVRAGAAARPLAERAQAILEVLVEELAADPAAARLVLVEAMAAPAAVRAVHDESIARSELHVARFLERQQGAAELQVPAVGLLGGIAGVLAARAFEGATDSSSTLSGDLSRWVDSYRLGHGTRALAQSRWGELGRFAKVVAPRETGEPPLLPRGANALRPAEVARARRERLLDATARLAASEGFHSVSVARIAAAARVPRSAFYSHFDGKREAVLAAQTHGLQGAMAAAAAAYSPAAPWPERVWKALEAFLTYVAEKADYARLEIVESFAAGPVAIRHRQQNQMVFSLFLEEGYRQNARAARLPQVCSEAIAAAIFGLMRKLIVERKTERMLSLLPAVAYTVLAPFIGARAAEEMVQVRARGAP